MGFTIPNDVTGGTAKQHAQAAPDSVDIDILVAGYALTGVQSGCAVSAQGSPNMTVAVASGTVAVAGSAVAVSSGNVTITAADASHPRFDLVVVNSSGVKSVTAGTAAAAPVFPAMPASSVVLAAVYVGAAVTSIGTADIVDKRVVVNSTAYAPSAKSPTNTTQFWRADGSWGTPAGGGGSATGVPTVINVKDAAYGAVGDGKKITVTTTATSTTVTGVFAAFTGSRSILIRGAGAAGVDLLTTFTCTVSNTGTLAVAASTSVTNAFAEWGTDDSTAIAAAVTAAKAAGGPAEVFFPESSGHYLYASTTPVDLAQTNSISFTSLLKSRTMNRAAQGNTGNPPVQLRYIALGSQTFINAQGHMGFGIEGIAIVACSVSYTGRLVDAGSGGSGTPSVMFTLCNAFIGGVDTTAALAVGCYLDGLVEGYFENFTFSQLADAVVGRDPTAGAGFCTAMHFNSGRFENCSDAAVLNPDQHWLFEGVVFEPASTANTAPSPIKSTNGTRPVRGLWFVGCGFWDFISGAGYWVDVWGSGVSFDGGYVDTLFTGAGLVRINTDNNRTGFDGLRIGTNVVFNGGTGTPWTLRDQTSGGTGVFTNLDIGGLIGLGGMTDPTGSVALTTAVAFAPQRSAESLGTLGNSGAGTVSLTRDNFQTVTLTGNCTFAAPTVPSGVAVSMTLELVQDGTGSRTVTWPASFGWGSAGAPALSTAPNAVDVVTAYTVNGGTKWRAFLAGKAF